MTRSDLIAQILINNNVYPSAEIAKQAILKTFKEEYPYWSYSDWDQTIPRELLNPMMVRTKGITNPSIKHLIVDLDSLLSQSNGSHDS
jgi:hypothetical protein